MKYPTLDTADLSGKRVLLRAGFDVPLEDGEVQDTTRVEALVPTMKCILDAGASLILLAHQGRPKAGERDPAFSQRPLVPILQDLLKAPVHFADSCVGDAAKQASAALQPGEVLLLENVRYEAGEKSKSADERDALGKQLAALADVYVNDAFTNCHRDHASMTSIPKFIGKSYIGLNVQKEVEGLSHAIENPAKPLTLIISGLKMETKVPVIKQFLTRGDDILVGGGVANTLLVSLGKSVGGSKFDADFTELAGELLSESSMDENADIHVPVDGVSPTGTVAIPIEDEESAIFDIGPDTVRRYVEIISQSKTIVWNGPMGMYEAEEFAEGTRKIAEAVAAATAAGAVSIVGGGDTLDFHDKYGYPLSAYTFVSTAGGAMLDFISGKRLPALESVECRV